MAEDVIKTRGKLKSTKPDSGGGVTLDHPVIGIVKDNIDPTRSGRIKVQIEGSTNTDSNRSDGWYTVQYLSTYFGMVRPTAPADSNGDYVGNPSAYGQWQSPPDIGNKVLCIFANGDPNRGYYIGCVVEPEAAQMVPAIGSSDYVIPNEGESLGVAGATRVPVTSINTNNKKIADSTNYLDDAAKPIHSYTASIMAQQGIIRDPIRGPISSSASREPVSRVGWGVATPGRPIMEGGYDDENLPENLKKQNQDQLRVIARRGGHSIVMDDGDIIGRDQLIRIRTALGHQILMSDDGQTLMILHSNGQSYVELGKEGTVDIFSTNSFNVRTQGDINFHADQHINFHATENMNIQAKQLHINTEENFKMRAGKALQLYSVGNFTVNSLSGAAIKASGQASLASSTITFINGLRIFLNTGRSTISPPKVPIITLISQTDTLHDEAKGFIAAPGKLLTVTTRTPAHYPWTNAGQGVEVKNTLDATKVLPVTPSAGVQKANQAGAATGAPPPPLATAASAPDTNPISKSLDKTVTNTLMGSAATVAANGPARKAVEMGAAIVDAVDSATKIVAVGTYAQSPTQMCDAGVLKPGADRLINGLAQKPGAELDEIMSRNLFSGQPGAVDLTNYSKDTTAQTTAMIDVMQKVQTTLGKVGVVTGKETSTQLAGLVNSGTVTGVQRTVDAVTAVSKLSTTDVKKVSGAFSGLVSNDPETKLAATETLGETLGAASTVLTAIGLGGSAAKVANKIGSIGGIATAVSGITSKIDKLDKLDKLGKVGEIASVISGIFGGASDGPSFTQLVENAKGPAAAAFIGIRDSLKPLQPNVPQRLSAVAKTSAATTAAISSTNSAIDKAEQRLVTGPGGVVSASDLNQFLENNTAAGITGSSKQPTNSQPTSAAISAAIQRDSSVTDVAVRNVTTAVQNINGSIGAAPAIASGDMKELSAAATAVQSGASAAKAASLASGVDNLPGGVRSTATVVNNAADAINLIPGTEGLRNVIADASSAASKGLKVINTVTTITDTIDKLKLGGALAKEGGLTNAISSKLPLGQASELLSAIAGLGGGGAAKVKPPSIGFNTFDRSTLSNQIINMLENPKIPFPNLLGDIRNEVVNRTEQLIQQNKEKFKIFEELEKYEEMIKDAQDALYQAEADFPAGDPKIRSAETALDALLNDSTYLALKKKIASFGELDASEAVKKLMSNAETTASDLLNMLDTSKIASEIKSSTEEALQQTTSGTALQTVKGQGSTAISILQAEAALNEQEMNNSLSGVTGPAVGRALNGSTGVATDIGPIS